MALKLGGTYIYIRLRLRHGRRSREQKSLRLRGGATFAVDPSNFGCQHTEFGHVTPTRFSGMRQNLEWSHGSLLYGGLPLLFQGFGGPFGTYRLNSSLCIDEVSLRV